MIIHGKNFFCPGILEKISWLLLFFYPFAPFFYPLCSFFLHPMLLFFTPYAPFFGKNLGSRIPEYHCSFFLPPMLLFFTPYAPFFGKNLGSRDTRIPSFFHVC